MGAPDSQAVDELPKDGLKELWRGEDPAQDDGGLSRPSGGGKVYLPSSGIATSEHDAADHEFWSAARLRRIRRSRPELIAK